MSADIFALLHEYLRVLQNVDALLDTVETHTLQERLLQVAIKQEQEMWEDILDGKSFSPEQILRSLWIHSKVSGSGVIESVWSNDDIPDQLEDVRRLNALLLAEYYTRAATPEFAPFARYVSLGQHFAQNVLGILGGLAETRDTPIGQIAAQLNMAISDELAKNIHNFFNGEKAQRIGDVERALGALSAELDRGDLSPSLKALFRGYRSAWGKVRNIFIDSRVVETEQSLVDDFVKVFALIKAAADTALALKQSNPQIAENAQIFINHIRIVEENISNIFHGGLPTVPMLTGLLNADVSLLRDAEFKTAFVELTKAMTALRRDLKRLVEKQPLTETYIRNARRLFIVLSQDLSDSDNSVETVQILADAFHDDIDQFVNLLWIPGAEPGSDKVIRNALREFPDLAAKFRNRIEQLLHLRKKVITTTQIARIGVTAGPSSPQVPAIEASWAQTEERLQDIAVRVHTLGTSLSKSGDPEAVSVHAAAAQLGKAHKAVKAHRASAERGEKSDSIPAEKLLYNAVKALRASPATQEHKTQLKELIASAPTQSTLVKVQIIIRSQDASLADGSTKPLFRKRISEVIICPTTTYQQVLDAETDDSVNKALNRYGRTFGGAGASFTVSRTIRSNKRFISRVENLSQQVLASKFQYTDSSGRIERRDFPMGRKFRNDVTLSFVFVSA